MTTESSIHLFLRWTSAKQSVYGNNEQTRRMHPVDLLRGIKGKTLNSRCRPSTLFAHIFTIHFAFKFTQLRTRQGIERQNPRAEKWLQHTGINTAHFVTAEVSFWLWRFVRQHFVNMPPNKSYYGFSLLSISFVFSRSICLTMIRIPPA